MFNFSKTDAHICFTEYGLSIYCVKCKICDVTYNSLQESVILRYQRNFNNQHFFSGPKYKTSLNEYYTIRLGQ